MKHPALRSLELMVAALAVTSCNRTTSIAEQKAKEKQSDAEMRQFFEGEALRNAPLIAARNGLELKQVRGVMLALHKTTIEGGGMPNIAGPPSDEDRLTPLLNKIADAEQLPLKVVAQIAFDDALLKGCGDRD